MGIDGRGATSLAAMKFGATWGTAVECGASDGIRIESSGTSGGKEVVPDESLSGDAYGNAPNIGQELHRAAPSGLFRYGGRCSQILAAIMGTAGAPTEVESSLEYTHALSMETRLGDFVTWCERKGDVSVWEYDSAMFSRLTIDIGGRGPATFDADLVASKLTRDDTGTNTLATFANVKVRDPLTPVFLGDCRLRMNAQGGGALAGGDTIKPNLIRITFDRKMSEDFLADQALGRAVSLPEEEGDLEVFLQMAFPKYSADTYQALVDDGTEQKADLLITSAAAGLGAAASGLFHEYDFDFPRLVPVERPENAMTGPGRITDGVTFRVITATGNPTGMSSTTPVCLVRNQVSTNLLA